MTAIIASNYRARGPESVRSSIAAGRWDVELKSHRDWWLAQARAGWAIDLQVNRWIVEYGLPAWDCAKRNGWGGRGLGLCARWANTAKGSVNRSGLIDQLAARYDGDLEAVIDRYKTDSDTGRRRRLALRAAYTSTEPLPPRSALEWGWGSKAESLLGGGSGLVGGSGLGGLGGLGVAVVGVIFYLLLR